MTMPHILKIKPQHVDLRACLVDICFAKSMSSQRVNIRLFRIQKNASISATCKVVASDPITGKEVGCCMRGSTKFNTQCHAIIVATSCVLPSRDHELNLSDWLPGYRFDPQLDLSNNPGAPHFKDLENF